MKKLYGILLGVLLSLGAVAPAYAAEPTARTGTPAKDDAVVTSANENDVEPINETTRPHETFREEVDDDTAQLWFGDNLMIAGTTSRLDEVSVNGLLFGFGNQVQFNGTVRGEYTFVAGNIINYSANSKKDLFAAGATVELGKDAHIGRDVYAAGNVVDIESDLVGDLSIAAAQATLRNVKIAGNVNLSVGKLIIEGNVNIGGKLKINDDATIVGLDNAKYSEIEKYAAIDYEPTAAEIWFSKLYGVVALFIVFAILLAIYPRLDQKVTNRLSLTHFGIDVITGCIFLMFVPVLIIFLCLSLIGAPAALVLLVLYVLAIYLAQGFAGFWFGKLIVEKIAKSHTNRFVEALLGIALLACISLIPFVGWIVGLWSTVLGCGLILQTIKPCKTVVVDQNNPGTKTGEKVAKAGTPKSSTKTIGAKTNSTKTTKTTKTKSSKSTK